MRRAWSVTYLARDKTQHIALVIADRFETAARATKPLGEIVSVLGFEYDTIISVSGESLKESSA